MAKLPGTKITETTEGLQLDMAELPPELSLKNMTLKQFILTLLARLHNRAFGVVAQGVVRGDKNNDIRLTLRDQEHNIRISLERVYRGVPLLPIVRLKVEEIDKRPERLALRKKIVPKLQDSVIAHIIRQMDKIDPAKEAQAVIERQGTALQELNDCLQRQEEYCILQLNKVRDGEIPYTIIDEQKKIDEREKKIDKRDNAAAAREKKITIEGAGSSIAAERAAIDSGTKTKVSQDAVH